MTTLREAFATVHKKDIKNKDGVVVAQVDYVGWSQSADRLDEAEEVSRWSFFVVQMGQDWALGDLAIWDQDGNERHYQNVGYAENAEMAWKKEPLKDAVSDAFKRCAALAGVARYLYDKDSPQSGGRGVPSSSPRPSAPPPRPVAVQSGPEFPPNEWEEFAPIGGKSAPANVPTDHCPIHDEPWRGDPGDLYHGPKGVVEGGYCRHPDNVKKSARRAS